jgi:NAD(P)-dependent dehydrogenase (short-subunit alcohol dehydrogenase family)
MQPGSHVITGASSGIGRATALLLAEIGASLALLDIDEAAAPETAAACLKRGAGAAEVYRCDVTDEGQVADTVARVQDDLGTPTRLFANAGIDRGGVTHELVLGLWQSVISTNLTGTILTCKHVLGVMVHAGVGGSVVCTSSPGGFVAFSAGGAAAYSASKGAISALVRSLAIDYATHGIRVNAVVPGPTETPLMWANVAEDERDAVRRTVCAETPLGRLADPFEPARAVRWLLSDEASYVTGSHLVCDGGVLAKAALSV